MKRRIQRNGLIAGVACIVLSACSGQQAPTSAADGGMPYAGYSSDTDRIGAQPGESTIWDIFQNNDDPNVTVEVNRFIWAAAQDVLDFMPIERVDPFSGVMVYGYGVPPGGSQAYRATVYVRDPALDARSLNVALQTRSGPASTETTRAIEDAILTRARQLRIQAQNL